MTRTRRFFFSFSLVILFASVLYPAVGHPHLFIEPAVTVTQVPDGRVGFNIVWTWDPGWSYSIISNCDRNGDGMFNADETEFIFENFFTDLKTFDYFITIWINGQKVDSNKIENFIARATREQIVSYIFFIPANGQIAAGSKVKIVFNDDAFTAGFISGLQVRANGPFAITNIKRKTIQPFGVQAEFTIQSK